MSGEILINIIQLNLIRHRLLVHLVQPPETCTRDGLRTDLHNQLFEYQ